MSLNHRLALLLDGGGRFVALMRVTPETNRLVGFPHTRFDDHANDRLGLVADRLPALNTTRSFRLRGEYAMPTGGETALVFKEETA